MIRVCPTVIGMSLILLARAGAEEPRVWTDIRGKKITAELAGVADGTVILAQGSRRTRLPLRDFSAQDVQYLVKRYAAGIVFGEAFEPAPGDRSWYEAEFDRAEGQTVELLTIYRTYSMSYRTAPDAQLFKEGQPATLADFRAGDRVVVLCTKAPATSLESAGEIHALRSLSTPSVDRAWTSGTEIFAGRLVGGQGATVRLRVRGATGTDRSVPIAALSAADRESIRTRLAELGLSDLAPVPKGKRLLDAPATAFALGGSSCWARTWTDKAKRKMVARLTIITDGTGVFQQGGATSRVPLENLSAEDQAYVQKALTKGPPLSRLSYVLAGGSEKWDPKIRARVVSAMDFAVNLYNEVGRVDEKVLRAGYHRGVPTAQGNINGSLTFGGQIGNRVALHEICHCLGVGQHQKWGELMKNGRWTGPEAIAQLRQIDGPDAVLRGDRNHFWPYGMNFDKEASPENNRRHVLMVMALRRDMGLSQ